MKNNISKKKEDYSSVGSNITANEVDRVTILWVKKIQRFNKYVRAKPAIYLQFYKNRCEDLYTTFSITQPRSREEVLGLNHYKILQSSDSVRSETCTDIRNLENLKDNSKRLILKYYVK